MWFPGHWPQNYMGSLFKMQIPPSYSVGGNANWCSHCGKQYGGLSKKTKNRCTIWPSNSTPGYVVVQSLSHVQLFTTPWTAARHASLSFTISQSLVKLMSIESMLPSNHLILCCPLLLLPSISPSIRVFSNESALRIRWPKYWCFSFSVCPSNEYSGLISFRIDWFDLKTKTLIWKDTCTPVFISSVQSLGHVQRFATPWTAARQAPCPSPTPRACSNSCPSSRWCHPTISSSVILFSYLQSFPASESFPMSQFFASGGQSIGVSASSVHSSTIYNSQGMETT